MTYLGSRFTAHAFHKLLSIYVFSYFPFGFEDRIWDLIVSVPDHYLTFYSPALKKGGYTGFTLSFRNSVTLVIIQMKLEYR